MEVFEGMGERMREREVRSGVIPLKFFVVEVMGAAIRASTNDLGLVVDPILQ